MSISRFKKKKKKDLEMEDAPLPVWISDCAVVTTIGVRQAVRRAQPVVAAVSGPTPSTAGRAFRAGDP